MGPDWQAKAVGRMCWSCYSLVETGTKARGVPARTWSNGVTWALAIGTFIVMNVVRALLRAVLLPDHVRLTGLLGLLLWFGWFAFVIWLVVQRIYAPNNRPTAGR